MFQNVVADMRSHVHSNYTGPGYWVRVAGKALLSPAAHVTVMYRISHVLYRFLPTRPLAFLLRSMAVVWGGTEIHPGAVIGPGLCLVHSQKIVIGPGVVIGKNLRMSHGCSIGGDVGRGVAPNATCPVIGDDVTIALDSIVMGSLTVGDGAIISAQSLVVKDVAPYTLVAGSPARLVRRLENPHAPAADLDTPAPQPEDQPAT